MKRAHEKFHVGTAMSRRRAMTIVGAATGLPLFCFADRSRSAALYQWTGTSLGSPSLVLLYHHDRATAARIVGDCAAEIERLERIFALYRTDSEIVRLNRDGRIEFPSVDLLTVLSRCLTLSALSLGAFDVSVQPLWTLYATHFFGNAEPPPAGPAPQAIERVRKLVDWQAIDAGPRRIMLGRTGMGLTLNGIVLVNPKRSPSAWTSAIARCAPPAVTVPSSRRPDDSIICSIQSLEQVRIITLRFRSSRRAPWSLTRCRPRST